MTDPSARPARVPELDGIRGVAIALILLHHYFPPLSGLVPGSPVAYIGAALTLSFTGVDLFFVLSGYLIGGILLDHRDSPRLFRVFYVRRSTRILPLAFLCTILVLAAFAANLYPSAGTPLQPWSASVYLLFLANLWMAAAGTWGFIPLAHLWSLAIEEQFYLVAPVIIRYVRPNRIAWLLVALIAAAPLLRLGILAFDREATLAASLLPFCRVDCLGAGMLVAWITRHQAANLGRKPYRATLMLTLALSAVGCAVLTKLRAVNGGFAMAAGGYTVVAAFYASVLLLIETRRYPWLNRGMSLAPLVLLGRYSYFLYLFQGLVVGLVIGLLFHGRFTVYAPATWFQLGAGFAGLLLVAHLSWRWFESPLLSLGRRLAY